MYLQQTTLLVINITSLLNTNISNSNLVLYLPFKMHCLYNVSPQIVKSVSIYSCSCFAIVVPTIIPCCFSLFVEHCLFPTATIYHHIYHCNYYSFFPPTSSFFNTKFRIKKKLLGTKVPISPKQEQGLTIEFLIIIFILSLVPSKGLFGVILSYHYPCILNF
jgi:hypothetical protein